MDLPQLELPLANTANTANTAPEPPSDLAPQLAGVLAAISPQETPFEQIVTRAGLAAGEVSAAIVQLELLGLVAQLPGARYRRL